MNQSPLTYTPALTISNGKVTVGLRRATVPNAYADAINAAIQQQIEQARDYGGFLAQAGIPLSEAGECDYPDQVEIGYDRQLRDFPNG